MSLALLKVDCKSSTWLSSFLAFLTLYLGLILLDAQSFYISPQLYFIFLSILFLPGPLLLGYIGHISDRKYINFKDYLLCLLPITIVVTSSNLLSNKSLTEFATINDYQKDSYASLFSLVSIMAALHMLSYIILSVQLLLKLRQDWSSYQSKTMPKSWYRMLQVLLVILLVATIQLISSFINVDGDGASIGDRSFIFIVCYFIYSAVLIFKENRIDKIEEVIIVSQPSDTYFQATSDTEAGISPLSEELSLLAKSTLETELLYLQDDLSLSSLASQLDTTTHKLSQAINEAFNQSFYEFVNSFRVLHAAEKLASEPSASITDIYYASGFTAKSTFYNHFKKTLGCTPSQYRKNFLKNK
jgi:AraC-like DNA-binding protein